MSFTSILTLIGLVGLSLATGALGSLVTLDQIPTWYATIAKPSWTPPNWVFGPIWTTLYVLMGVAAFLVAQSKRTIGKVVALWVFMAHLVVNLLWSIAFFGLHELGLATGVIVLLIAMIVLLMRLYVPHSRVAVLLMVPYLLWTLYATSLTIGVWVLN